MSEIGYVAWKHKSFVHAFYVHNMNPSYYGPMFLKWISEHLSTPKGVREFREKLDDLEYVNPLGIFQNDPAPEYLQEKYKIFSDLIVSENTLADWYCLLFKLQRGTDLLEAVRTGTLRHVPDSAFALTDPSAKSVFLLNMNTKKLEYWSRDEDPWDRPRGQWRPYLRWKMSFQDIDPKCRVRWQFEKGDKGAAYPTRKNAVDKQM